MTGNYLHNRGMDIKESAREKVGRGGNEDVGMLRWLCGVTNWTQCGMK